MVTNGDTEGRREIDDMGEKRREKLRKESEEVAWVHEIQKRMKGIRAWTKGETGLGRKRDRELGIARDKWRKRRREDWRGSGSTDMQQMSRNVLKDNHRLSVGAI